MLRLLWSFISPIISFFIFMTGSSLLTTVLGLVFQNHSISHYWTAGLTCFYYAGYVLSAIHVERYIARVGFIRAHATFASLTTVSALLHVFWLKPWAWLLLRFSYGVGLAGLSLTTQNWFLHSESNPRLRGRMLAIYMITMYASQSFGQYILKYMDIKTFAPFCFVACCTALCVIPVSMTKMLAPMCEQHSIFGISRVFQISPSGALGGLCSGIMLGSVYGILPILLQEWGHPLQEISNIMAIVIIGGMLLQYPIGKLSDRFERRRVLMSTSLLGLLLTLGLLATHHFQAYRAFLWLTLFWGGILFTIYPLSINLACDLVQSKDLLATTGGLMVSYSIGASAGPFIAAFCMYWMGPSGVYILFLFILAFLSTFVFYRMRKREGLQVGEQKAFTPMPASGAALALSRLFAKLKRRPSK